MRKMRSNKFRNQELVLVSNKFKNQELVLVLRLGVILVLVMVPVMVLVLVPALKLEWAQGLVLGIRLVLMLLALLLLVQQKGQRLVQKLLLLLKPEEQDRFIRQWISKLPEDRQADLNELRGRWFKRGYSNRKIRHLTLWHLFHMKLADVKIKLDDLLLY